MSTVTIYHNPDCGTSRNVLALIRNAGIEPQVIEYLKTPPSRDELQRLIAATGAPVRELMRAQDRRRITRRDGALLAVILYAPDKLAADIGASGLNEVRGDERTVGNPCPNENASVAR